MTATSNATIAELQRANAALQARLDAALAQRDSEYGERVGHQAAMIDVLRLISASPGDPRPVFDLIVERARDLCNGHGASLCEFDGSLIHLRAANGVGDNPSARQAYAALFPMVPTREWPVGRAILDRRLIRIDDYDTETGLSPAARGLPVKSGVQVPLMRGGEPIGALGLDCRERGAFSDSQLELLKTFAEQAVIAITAAETHRALQTRTAELQESLEQQSATADVLRVINASPGDLTPVFDAMLEKAMRLCGAAFGILGSFDGELVHTLASRGVPAAFAMFIGQHQSFAPRPGNSMARALQAGRPAGNLDIRDEEGYKNGAPATRAVADLGGARTVLHVPLVKDQASVGLFTFYRQEVHGFSDKQVALLENFANQAVIAMENARLLGELRTRDADNSKLIHRQAASIEILKTISASPDDPQPMFDLIVLRAVSLCDATSGGAYDYDGALLHPRSFTGYSTEAEARLRAMFPRPPGRETLPGRVVLSGQVHHITDFQADMEIFQAGRGLGVNVFVAVPIISEGRVIGVIAVSRHERRPFDDGEIGLLQSFADQAAIAIASAKTLRELRARTEELAQRQAELRVTFENMGDGVAMFDAAQRLIAWNRKFQDILDLPDGVLAEHQTFPDYIRYLAERGEYGADADAAGRARRVIESAGQRRTLERTRPDGRVLEIRNNPVDGGGFVVIYADITERKRNEAAIAAARDAAEAATRTIESAFRDLKTAQANLIQAEKMASLGLLTAGIAHEIKNPLNFVNNFASLSIDLLDELKETAAPGFAALNEAQHAEVEDVSAMLTGNLSKIVEHGKRADGIVKAMLEHSRGASGERRAVDINALAEEALNLAYHGARAQDRHFDIMLERDYAEAIPPIELNPQDMTRVFLNLFGNGFYAARKRQRSHPDTGFVPALKVTTQALADEVRVSVRDNGTGIPPDIREKLFQPFFTTKPAGEGTGLGLSITYDIVTKQHGGTIAVDSEPGAYTEFTVTLPRHIFTGSQSRA